MRADRIQSDLDELMKGLVDRCGKLSTDVKPKALIVLPAGILLDMHHLDYSLSIMSFVFFNNYFFLLRLATWHSRGGCCMG